MLVVCCGMPRSGSTLQFNVVWKVVTAADRGERLEWRPQAAWEGEIEALRSAAEDERISVMKSHQVPRAIRELSERHEGVRFVYVHRDIRDVVYSMKLKFKFSLSHALSRVDDSVALEHWLSRGPRGHTLVQDYELLLADLPAVVGEIAGFLDVDLSAEQIRGIAAELDIDSAFVRSRAKEVRFEHARRLVGRVLRRKPNFADDELMLHPNHVSEHKGVSGVWRDGLSPAEIEAIEERFGERIRRGFGG